MRGAQSPQIIYGTAWKGAQTAQLVANAIRQGFRGIDTACQPKHYDEAGVGEGIAAACVSGGPTRADLYVQTKFTPVSGQDPSRIPYDPRAPLGAQVAQSFQTSLRNLQTAYVDCLVLHSPLQEPEQTAQVWQAMETIAAARGAKQLGISNCYSLDYLTSLHASASIKPAVVQNRFYSQTGYDRDIRAFCKDFGIVYQSFWTLTANRPLLAHAALLSVAAKHGRSAAQVLFRYLTQEGAVPLTGTKSGAHMREDLAIFEFELADEERRVITALLLRD